MTGSSYKKKRMITVNIKIEKNGEYIFYTVYGNNSKMCTDKEIAKFFDISVDEYKERLKKLNITKFYDKDDETFLVDYINKDKLIEIFKEEFLAELTIAKINKQIL